MTSRNTIAFTLLELLVVIVIIVALAGITFPVLMHAQNKARQTVCVSNLRQLGVALIAYCQDNDERTPNGVTPPTLFKSALPVNMGWAGRIFSYVKSREAFHCPADTDRTGTSPDPRAYPVSYALNLNLALSSPLASLAAPSRTVLLFEVTRNRARITAVDEGMHAGGALPQQLSAVGDGTSGTILDRPVVDTGGPSRLTLYATGRMDNSEGFDAADDYQGQRGRHQDAGNFLAGDGHVAHVPGSAISAGLSSALATKEQTHSGCTFWGNAAGRFPCAEGTAVGKHTLTFSTH